MKSGKPAVFPVVTLAVAALAVGTLCAVVFFGPRKSGDEVREKLDTYVERVASGAGGFAGDFYALLNRYDNRIDRTTKEEYLRKMHEVLEERFNQLLSALRNGDLSLLGDAREWAKLFPEKKDRQEKKKLLEDIGSPKIQGALERFFGKLRDLGDRAAEWVRTRTEER